MRRLHFDFSVFGSKFLVFDALTSFSGDNAEEYTVNVRKIYSKR